MARYYSIWRDVGDVLTHKESMARLLSIRQRARLGDLLTSTFLRQEYRWLYSRIRPGTTLLDLGANIGDTATYFAMNPNVRRVIAYEANARIFDAARSMLASSPLSAKISLNHGTVSQGNLPRILMNRGANVAIKCDIEGAEAKLFDGADLKNVYALQIEYHDCLPELSSALRKMGFRVAHSGSGKMGMVYASR